MSVKPKLTIAIPTFNRVKPLGETLRRLLPQISDDWVLLILDNCSDQPVAEIQANLLAGFGKDRVTVIRNAVNVGACANVLRCFEYCSTEWLIVLGDDDEATPDYVATFLTAISKHPSSVFVNFSCNLHYRKFDYTTSGLSEFFQSMLEFGNILTLSCGAYNRNALAPYLRYGYTYSYTLSPHFAVLLQYLKVNGGKCAFYSKEVVSIGISDVVETWCRYNQNKFVFLLELIPDRANQQAFLKGLRPFFISPKSITLYLMDRFNKTGEDPRFFFETLTFCFTCLQPRFRHRLKLPLMHLLAAHPRFGFKLLRLSRWLCGYGVPNNVDTDLHRGF
jgi:glycosyltransferase involved in cell wall biosynthesis